MLFSYCADLHHLVFVELFLLVQFGHCSDVLVLSSLGIHHAAVPFRYFLQHFSILQLLDIQTVVTKDLLLVPPLLESRNAHVVVNSHLGKHLMEELGSNPHTELGTSWQATVSFADVSDRPTLEVELVNGVYGFGGESCL